MLKLLRKKKKDLKPEEQQQEIEKAKKSVNDWLPFHYFDGNLAKTKDGRYLAYIKVEPININLKSDNEIARLISSLHECFNAKRESFQIEILQRPQDLDGYIREISELQQNETQFQYKKLLTDYLRYVSGLIASGQTMEKQFYIILSRKESKGVKEELLNYAEEFCNELLNASLTAKVLDSSEILEFWYTFYNPTTSAFEKIVIAPGFSI